MKSGWARRTEEADHVVLFDHGLFGLLLVGRVQVLLVAGQGALFLHANIGGEALGALEEAGQVAGLCL